MKSEPTSVVIRCSQCGTNNNSGNCLCLTCGDVLESRERPAGRAIPRQQYTLSPVKSALIVRAPAEPKSRMSHPDEARVSHPGRNVALVFLGLLVVFAGVQRWDLRVLASKLSKEFARQSNVTNSSPASVSVPDANVTSKNSHEPAKSASNRDGSGTEETLPRDSSPERSVAAIGPSRPPSPAPSTNRRSGDALGSEGEKYLYGDGVPSDCERARKDLLAAARHLSARAQSDLGTMYATGHCATRDLPLAYRWFARAQRQSPVGRQTIAEDMKGLWEQMSPEERRLAVQ